MGRNAQRRRERRHPLKRLGRLIAPLVVGHATGEITVVWNPANPEHRRRVRRITAEAERRGYPVNLGEESPDA